MRGTNLYHCTKAQSLLKILDCKYFKPMFCLEQYTNVGVIKVKGAEREATVGNMAFAIVSFADLLPSELKNHMDNFHADSFISLSMEWAERNAISPVVYCNQGSIISSGVVNILTSSLISLDKNVGGNNPLSELVSHMRSAVSCLFPFIKQYQGCYYDKLNHCFSSNERQFFLEREWRYIHLVLKGETYYLEENQFKDIKFRHGKENELVNHNTH